MARLTLEQVKYNLSKVPGWELSENQLALSRSFRFCDFPASISFVSRLAEHVDQESEHVEMRVTGGRVQILLTTPTVNGLTGKDFALAQLISKLA